MNALYYGCNCPNCDVILADYFKDDAKIRALCSAQMPNTRSYENGTINALLKFSRDVQGDAYILYLHTKGTTNKTNAQKAWRDFMMYWMVYQYETCIDLLDRGFDTVGSQLINCTSIIKLPSMYAGNFWWARAAYLRKVPYIEDVMDRYQAETILLSSHQRSMHAGLPGLEYISAPSPINGGLYYFDAPKIDYIDETVVKVVMS
jgi:hypothetical protein